MIESLNSQLTSVLHRIYSFSNFRLQEGGIDMYSTLYVNQKTLFPTIQEVCKRLKTEGKTGHSVIRHTIIKGL